MTLGKLLEGCSMEKSVERMLERLSDRMAALLKQVHDWKGSASTIEAVLDESGLQVDADKSSPAAFARSLFLDNPSMAVLAERAIKNKVDLYAVDDPLDLVNNLLPSDHHLD